MKELRLDVEVAKSGGYLNGTRHSRNVTNSNTDIALQYLPNKDSICESARSFKSENKIQISHIGNMVENTFRQLDQEIEVNVARAAEEEITDDIIRDNNMKGKSNRGFLQDYDKLSVQKFTRENIDSDTTFKVEGQHSISLADAVTSSNSAIGKLGNSKKTRTTPCSDPVFRNKLLKTIFLFWNTTTLGWGYGQMGPVFPDLQDIAGVSLKQGSWLFTGFAVGYLAGCLLAGFTQTRFSSNLMLFIYTIISACAFLLLPWIPLFEVMVFLRALIGIGFGGQDTCVHTMLFEYWGDKAGPYFQMMYVLFAVGGIISPLATKPFLRRDSQDKHLDIANVTKTISLQNATPSVDSVVSTNNTTHPDDVTMTSTEVHYALLITGLLLLSASVPFLIMFSKDQHARKSQRQKNADKVSPSDQKRLPRHIEKIVLCFFLLNSFVATAALDLFPSFLTTFLIEQAGITQQVGSNLTSIFFAMLAVGNFLNIFASVYIKTTKVIIFSYISTVALFTGVLLSVIYPNEELLSAFVSLSGVSTATIIPTIYTWIQEHVTPITGTLASGLLISGSLGIALNPLLIGYLMDVYSPMWFMYLSLGNIFLCAVLFIVAMLLTKIFSNKMIVNDESIRGNQTDANEINERNIDIYVNGILQKVYEITHL